MLIVALLLLMASIVCGMIADGLRYVARREERMERMRKVLGG